jgi:DNA replication protein DnaC
MTIDLADVQLDALLKRLHLANARRAWRDLVQRAEREEWSYRDFLALLVTEEIARRQQTRITRMVRRAHFPFFKRSTISISRCSRPCDSRSSARPSPQIS